MARRRISTRSGRVQTNLNPALRRWRSDYAFSTTVSAAASLGVTTLFALYNGFLGINLGSLWNGTICAYYLLLVAIRGSLLLTEWKVRGARDEEKERSWTRALLVSAIMLLVLNLALIYPIAMMTKFEKVVDVGLIPAITMAAYTTYKITMSAIHLRKRSKVEGIDPVVKELRTINFIDALVSILVLQNTLIMVNSAKTDLQSMLILSAVSSAVIYIVIVFISIRLLRNAIRQKRA